MVAISLAVLLAGAASAAVLQPRAACVSGNAVHIIVARGTTEPQGNGLETFPINSIIARLPGSDSESVVYPASFDLPSSANQGINAAINQTTSYATQCPNSKIVLMGYSQGAQVIGDTIAGGGTVTPNGARTQQNAPLPDSVMSKVVAIILFGNPGRIGGQSYDVDFSDAQCIVSATNPRTGANAAKFNSYGSRIQDYCNAQDPVCCSSAFNFLAHLSYFNPTNNAAIANFVAGKAA